MFRFENIWAFIALVAIPILIFLYFFYSKKYTSKWNQINPTGKLRHFIRGNVPTLSLGYLALLIAYILFASITLANPQLSNKKETVDIESTDVFIAMDISHSMLAEDVKPNRLERAKYLTTNLLKQLEGNRLGLILFAGEAYMYMPLTSDISAALSFLESANTKMAPTQGTAIAASIDMAIQSFDPDNTSGKAIVLLSDGEDHEEAVQDAIDRAKDAQVYVFTIAVGTPEGAYLPGTENDNYLFDENGKPVHSKVNTTMLMNIAQKTNANFFNLASENNIDKAIKNNIDQMEKQITAQASFDSYESYYQFFLFPILLFLGWELLRSVKTFKNT